MTLLNALTKKLPAELMAQVRDALGDDFDFDYVPRTRLNTVIGQRNELRTQLADVQADGKGAPEDAKDDDVDDKKPGTKVTKTVKDDKGPDLEAIKAQHIKEMSDLKIRYALTEEMRAAGVKKPELLMAQFDFSKLSVDEAGKLVGHAEGLEAWKESDPYLFSTPGDDVPPGTGVEGAKGGEDKSKVTAVDAQLNNIFGITV